MRALHRQLRAHIAATEGVTIHTSAHAELSCGLLAFTMDGFKNRDLVDTLLRRYQLHVRAIEYGLNAVRVSTHYYSTEAQIDRIGDALLDIRKRGVLRA